MKVAELEGARLDHLVAKALFTKSTDLPDAAGRYHHGDGSIFSPSRYWAHGGPIIDSEHICLSSDYCGTKFATMNNGEIKMQGPESGGYLVLAMRCLVASKFGKEVPIE